MTSNAQVIAQRRVSSLGDLKKRFGDPQTLDDLAWFVINAVNDSLLRADPTARVVGFAWNVGYSKNVSNSHNSPANGVCNWGGREVLPDGSPAPRGYPGFSGRVWIRINKRISGFASSHVSRSFTHPGTGGFGSYDGPWNAVATAYYANFRNKSLSTTDEPMMFSWDYRFYMDDFPEIANLVSKTQVYQALANLPIDNPEHRFTWTNPDVVKQDAEFISYVNQQQRA